jgi:hypothetical protein
VPRPATASRHIHLHQLHVHLIAGRSNSAVMAMVTQAEELPERRSPASEIVAAIDLGWRVALLHAPRPSTFTSTATGEDLLLNRAGLGVAAGGRTARA